MIPHDLLNNILTKVDDYLTTSNILDGLALAGDCTSPEEWEENETVYISGEEATADWYWGNELFTQENLHDYEDLDPVNFFLIAVFGNRVVICTDDSKFEFVL